MEIWSLFAKTVLHQYTAVILLYIKECEGCVLGLVFVSLSPPAQIQVFISLHSYLLCVCVGGDSWNMSWENLAVQFATSEGRCWFMCNAHLNVTPL